MYAAVVDVLGREIVAGTFPAGSVVSLASLEERFEVSRTVAREAMRSLESRHDRGAPPGGLIVADRPAGTSSIPSDRMAPRRPTREDQMRSLMACVSPSSRWRPTSVRSTHRAHRSTLLEMSRRLWELTRSGLANTQAFRDADARFHTTLLQSSANEMFIALAPALVRWLPPDRTVASARIERSLTFHEGIARAIAAGDGPAAEDHCRQLVALVRDHIGVE
jgi:DNA-binding FadR family transcriptional regulator